jgi:hypothetical protein
MPLIQSGKTFNDGEQLTAGKLNQMFSDASLSTAGVDGTSIIVNANDVLAVRSINSARIDSGAVITDKLPDSTVTASGGTPDGVTLPKLQHIETGKILGRTTALDGVVEDLDIVIGSTGDTGVFFDNDDMLDNSDTAGGSATRGATQQSIKAYVDTSIPGAFTPSVYAGGESVKLPNGLTMKTGFFSDETGGSGKLLTYLTPFDTATISVQLTQVGTATTGTRNLQVESYDKSGFSMYVNAGANVLGSFWMALGY